MKNLFYYYFSDERAWHSHCLIVRERLPQIFDFPHILEQLLLAARTRALIKSCADTKTVGSGFIFLVVIFNLFCFIFSHAGILQFLKMYKQRI
jgi:hypothetical protein